jgi:hypothetical protein
VLIDNFKAIGVGSKVGSRSIEVAEEDWKLCSGGEAARRGSYDLCLWYCAKAECFKELRAHRLIVD